MDLDGLTAEVDALLADADEAYARQFPGPSSDRGPIQTLYVAAGDFHDQYVRDAGREAEQLLLEHAEEFLGVLGGDDALMGRVLEKLATESVEDLRIDFAEPARDQTAEDARTDGAALAWGTAAEADALSRCGGIRVPGLGAEDRARSVRTLGRFLDALGAIPEGFVVTVPAVATIAQVEALVRLADLIEKHVPGRLTFEVQIENPQAVLGPKGAVVVAKMIHHAEGRLVAMHLVPDGFGGARLADHALTQVRAACHDTGVRVADGSTLVVPPRGSVVEGWQSHLDLVRRTLARGFVQGRDSHSSQLPTRYAATYAHEAAESAR
ncbi:MAG: hypothetical protein WKF50_08855 [Nocardioides sp.]